MHVYVYCEYSTTDKSVRLIITISSYVLKKNYNMNFDY